jgi:hypothetical protein
MPSPVVPTAAALALVACFIAGIAGCDGPPSVIGSWYSMAQPTDTQSVQWAFEFTDDGKVSLALVTTSTATAGRGAGCMETVAIDGVYTTARADSAAGASLTLTAQSGTTQYDSCVNPAENTAATALPQASLDMFSADLSGPFTVTEQTLTLHMPASGPASGPVPGVLTRQI